MNLTNSQKKSHQYCKPNQSTTTFQSLLYHLINFNQIKSKKATNNMSNAHISPDVLLNLLLLQQVTYT